MMETHLKPFSLQARTYKGNPSCDQRIKRVLEIPETYKVLNKNLGIKLKYTKCGYEVPEMILFHAYVHYITAY